jgi:type II secretory pathway component PulC
MRFACSLVVLSTGAWLLGCGSAPPPAPVAVAAPQPAPVVVLDAPGAPVIRRAELDAVLDAGLGLFLQRVATEPDLRDGRFVGFRVVELHDETLFAAIDLAPGDTIVAVNGQGIERPEHAYTVWTSLRVASELSLAILRGDERRELRFAIVD